MAHRLRPEGGGAVRGRGPGLAQRLCSGLCFSAPSYSCVYRMTDIGDRQINRWLD